MTDELDARYGRTRTRSRRDRLILVALAGTFVVVFGAWVIWAGQDGAKPVLEARDTSHRVLDDRTVSVTFEVSMPAGENASCAVQALNEQFVIVGWRIVAIPASEQYTRSFTEVLRTTQPSNTGLIYRCWLT
ncbi:DUF4307 domain-containing protein [Luethyella okanaganae]|uniref:DUF4307 domain-containing protein n=1 Tax=Luethyella okanaganae TaxID=69372 RepID=A0ABW1VE82_9MICO